MEQCSVDLLEEIGSPHTLLAVDSLSTLDITAAFGVTQARSAGLLDGSIHPLRPFLDGVLAWFVIDTSATVALGATANAVGNAAFLLLLAGPVWLAMRAMQWKPRAAKDSTRATSLAHSGA